MQGRVCVLQEQPGFFQVFQFFGKMLPFTMHLVLLLWLRWSLDKTLLFQDASIHCRLYFTSDYGLESGCCFLKQCTTSYLPVMQLATSQRCTDLCGSEKLHCLVFWFCYYYCFCSSLIMGLFICGLFFICPSFKNTVGCMLIFNFCGQIWYG